MTIFKKSAAFLLGFVLMAGSAFAQGNMQQQMQQTQPDSITDQELKKFAAVTQDVNKKVNEKIDSLLADKDMSPDRFQEIMMSKRNPQADSAKVTDQEQKTIDEVQPKLMQTQQKELMNAIQNNGLQPQRFQAIVQALQTNPKVVQRYRKIVGAGQGQGQN